VGEVGSIMVNKNSDSPREAKKRNITLLDATSATIELTLWGKHADLQLNIEESPILAIKGARVSTYNSMHLLSVSNFQDRTLSAGISSQIQINPDIPGTNNSLNAF